jgi:hypothetical protein
MARFGRINNMRPNANLATVLALLALVIAIIALARSGGSSSTADNTSDTTTTTLPVSPITSTTTLPSIGTGTISVPNVVGLPRTLAISQIQAAGLKADVQQLPLSNVPSGYVVSQSPLAATRVAPGTSVALVLSSAA